MIASNFIRIKMTYILIKVQKFVIKHNKEIFKLLITVLRIQIVLIVTHYNRINLLTIVFGKIKDVDKQQRMREHFIMVKFKIGMIYRIIYAKMF